MTDRKYGWLPDLPDHRDLKFTRPSTVEFKTVRLGDTCKLPPIVDQGNLGSCTANGLATIIGFNLLNQHAQDEVAWFQPSRLFIYYEERAIEHTIKWDAGAQIRDGIKVLANSGTPDEKLWPYVVSKFATRPPQTAYKSAANYQAIEYQRIDNTDKGALLQALYEGFPIVFGFSVYQSFESDTVAKTGIVPMPGADESFLGGHCMVIDGYDVTTDRFEGPNSWGTSWGNAGRYSIGADYLTNAQLADDFWIVNLIE